MFYSEKLMLEEILTMKSRKEIFEIRKPKVTFQMSKKKQKQFIKMKPNGQRLKKVLVYSHSEERNVELVVS